MHDFLIKELGRAVPYGVYDLADDVGWISVGMDHDTSAFAVQSIRGWWAEVGRARHPSRLLKKSSTPGRNNEQNGIQWSPERNRTAAKLCFSAAC